MDIGPLKENGYLDKLGNPYIRLAWDYWISFTDEYIYLIKYTQQGNVKQIIDSTTNFTIERLQALYFAFTGKTL